MSTTDTQALWSNDVHSRVDEFADMNLAMAAAILTQRLGWAVSRDDVIRNQFKGSRDACTPTC